MEHMASVLLGAVGYLRTLVEAERAAGRRRLPTIAVLASRAGVSQATMWAAVQVLVRQGVVTARPKSGIVICSGRRVPLQVTERPEATESVPVRVRKWRDTSNRLRQDIVNSVFAPGGDLPTRKELSLRYGVSGPTLGRALHHLMAEGIIVRDRRRLRVPAAQAGARGRGVVVLIAAGDENGEIHQYSPRTGEYIRVLEGLCARASVDLATVACDDDSGRLFPQQDWDHVLTTGPSASPLLGFILLSGSLRRHPVSSLLRQLARYQSPIAVLDEAAEVTWSAVGKVSQPVRLFRLTDGVAAARRIANRLMSLGHRSIAYLSPSHRAIWSRDRLTGLEQAFAEAGIRDGVTAYTVDDPFSHALHLSGDYPLLHEEVQHHLQSGQEHGGHPLMQPVLAAMARQIDSVAEQVAYTAKVLPLVDRALTNPSHTVWVGANDHCIAAALPRLRGHGRRIPRDLSLVGFDNTPEAYTHSFTSYDFNSPAAMQAMLNFVLHPGQPLYRSRKEEPVVVEGHLAVRRSLGRVGGAGAG